MRKKLATVFNQLHSISTQLIRSFQLRNLRERKKRKEKERVKGGWERERERVFAKERERESLLKRER